MIISRFKTARNDASAELVSQIRALRTASSKRKIRKRKKLPKMVHPKPIERDYSRKLTRYLNILEEIVKLVLVSRLPELARERDADLPAGGRIDSWAEDAERLLGTMNMGFGAVPFDVPGTARDVADKTNVWNDIQWRRMMKAAVGVDMFQREPWLIPVTNSFVMENVVLITKMEQDLKDNIAGTVQRGFRGGARHEKIAEDVMGAVDVSKSRARLIARDQVSKLNGQLTQNRQTGLGISEYIWRGAADARERPTHIANNDKKFKWSEAPDNTGHPGNDIQCRCYAEPVMDELIDELAGVQPEAPKKEKWMSPAERAARGLPPDEKPFKKSTADDKITRLFETQKTGQLPKDVHKAIKKYEDEIRHLEYEKGALMQVDKKTIRKRFVGEEGSVHMPGSIAGDIGTHNHPSGGAFSSNDFAYSIKNNLLQFRAAGSDGTYTVTRTLSNWVTPEAAQAYGQNPGVVAVKIKQEYDVMLEDAQKGFYEKVRAEAGPLDPAEYRATCRKVWHDLVEGKSRTLCSKYGWIFRKEAI